MAVPTTAVYLRSFNKHRRHHMKSVRTLLLATALGVAGSASAAWPRLPYAESRPVNLASKAIPGTSLTASNGIQNASSLISSGAGDPAVIQAGSSSAVLKLFSQQVVDNVFFVNEGAEGKATFTGSADNKDWSNLGHVIFSSKDRFVAAHFAEAQVKYVKVSFDAAKGGSIRSFNIFGAASDKDFKLKPASSSEGGVSVNLASGAGGAHAIYAFPSPTNIGELSARNNVFKFPKTSDKYRTIVYDLGTPRTVKQFSTSYSQRPVRIEVFAFEELPEKKDWRGKLTLDPAVFNTVKPVATGEDPRGLGHIRIVPSKPVTAQYVALRFEPNYQHNATGSIANEAINGFVAFNLGAVGALLDGFALLPRARFTAADPDEFIASIDDIGSSQTFTQNFTGGQGQGQGNGTGGGNPDQQNNPNNNFNPPYLPGTPGAPPASSLNTNTGTGGGGTGTSGRGVVVRPTVNNITSGGTTPTTP